MLVSRPTMALGHCGPSLLAAQKDRQLSVRRPSAVLGPALHWKLWWLSFWVRLKPPGFPGQRDTSRWFSSASDSHRLERPLPHSVSAGQHLPPSHTCPRLSFQTLREVRLWQRENQQLRQCLPRRDSAGAFFLPHVYSWMSVSA